MTQNALLHHCECGLCSKMDDTIYNENNTMNRSCKRYDVSIVKLLKVPFQTNYAALTEIQKRINVLKGTYYNNKNCSFWTGTS